MLAPEELGPFATIIPLVAVVICSVGAWYARGRPVYAVAFVGWFVAVQSIARVEPFHSDHVTWSDDLTDELLGVGLLITGMFAPLVALYLTYVTSPSLRQYLLHEIPLWVYVRFSFFRMAGASFLYLYLTGLERNYAVLHGGLCDVLIALTALPLSAYVRKHGVQKSRSLVTVWNFCGLVVDFVITLGLFSANLLGVFQPQYPLDIFLNNPLSTIILFNVPLASAMHVIIMLNFDEIAAASDAKDH